MNYLMLVAAAVVVFPTVVAVAFVVDVIVVVAVTSFLAVVFVGILAVVDDAVLLAALGWLEKQALSPNRSQALHRGFPC